MNSSRMIRCFLAVLGLIVAAARSDADDTLIAKINEVVDRPEYKQARWGILFVDAKTGKPIYERDPERLFVPASTTKLFSCAAALGTLGPDYRFTTPVHRRGLFKGGVLHGDLILVASGDLTFGGRTSKDGKTRFNDHDHTYAHAASPATLVPNTNPLFAFDEIAKQIAEEGIKDVRGEILVDDRLFDRARGSGSGPDLLVPMIVNDNVLDIVVTPGKKEGELATVEMRPESGFYQMDAQIVTVAKGKPRRLTIHTIGRTQFSIRGQIAVDAKPAVLIYNVDEPALFARALLIEAMRRQGIKATASIYRADRSDLPSRDECDKLPRVAAFTSAPLSEAIKVTLKVSHNLYASTLPLLVAAKHGERTLEQGLRRQGKFLKELGVPVETISFAGGAGGANADSITPMATVKLLQEMSKRPEAGIYFDALPILAVDGTLAKAAAGDSPAKGKVHAKTGTLMWHDAMNDRLLLRSKAMAGTMETAKGTKLFFAMFVNDVPLPKGTPTSREGKVLGKICEIVYRHGP